MKTEMSSFVVSKREDASSVKKSGKAFTIDVHCFDCEKELRVLNFFPISENEFANIKIGDEVKITIET
jgi:hypothetical protein